MIRVGVVGAIGRMGQEVVRTVFEKDGFELAFAVDIKRVGEDIGEIVSGKEKGVKIQSDLKTAISLTKPDVVVDFTQPQSIFENAKICLDNNIRPVIGTTGLSDEQVKILRDISESRNIGCLIAPNFSTGAVLMMMFSQMAAKYFDNAEIIELHHNQKKDAPSGTAIKTAQMMAQAKADFAKRNCEEFETVKGARGGKSYSDIRIHSVRMPGYIASQEVIFGSSGQVFKIRHDSMDRACYMPGVTLAIEFIAKSHKFIYGLENIL